MSRFMKTLQNQRPRQFVLPLKMDENTGHFACNLEGEGLIEQK